MEEEKDGRDIEKNRARKEEQGRVSVGRGEEKRSRIHMKVEE